MESLPPLPAEGVGTGARTAGTPAPPTAAASPTAAAPLSAITATTDRTPDIDRGKQIYTETCEACHGERGQGGHGGGAAFTTELDAQRVLETVNSGRNAMPAFGGALSVDEMQDVASYVRERLLRDRSLQH
jgi:mono/diheme cytochrome c family protein